MPDPKPRSPGEIRKELQSIAAELIKLRQTTEIGRWDIVNWVLSGAVGVAGIIFAPPTGGASLLLTLASFVLLAIDMAKKIYERAKDEPTRQRAKELRQRLEELSKELGRSGKSGG